MTHRVAALVLACAAAGAVVSAQTTERIVLRGHVQVLHLYGLRSGDPIVVSSGDAGWIRLGPYVAERLAANGFFVVGFDVRAYLAGFTSAKGTLGIEDEPDDYRHLAEFASNPTRKKAILVGVSEGAGLSVLAAGDPRTRPAIAGIIALGLPDVTELGWRWKDAVIWLTHGVPNEPTFSTAAIVGRIAPIPLAAIHSTHDEFVSLGDVRKVFAAAREPKRLWTVNASNHSFSDNRAEFDRSLLDAIAWVKDHVPR